MRQLHRRSEFREANVAQIPHIDQAAMDALLNANLNGVVIRAWSLQRSLMPLLNAVRNAEITNTLPAPVESHADVDEDELELRRGFKPAEEGYLPGAPGEGSLPTPLLVLQDEFAHATL